MTEPTPTLIVDVTPAIDGAEAAQIRLLMGRALAFELQDDRFDAWPRPGSEPDGWQSPPGFQAALASVGPDLVGFLGGPVTAELARFDTLIALNAVDPEAVFAALLDALPALRSEADPERVEIWAKPAAAWHLAVAERRAFTEIRALHQMRCELPVDIEPLPTRPYRPHDDLEALRSVNNRAFHAHPDQGNQTVEGLLATMSEPWFRPEGVRIHERDGRMIGFCWTKIHDPRPSLTEPAVSSVALGEIYVIGVDPDFHGQGLGAPMTAAGLHWLHQEDLTKGMLYVEADNVAAVRTYQRLGFSIVRTDQAWLVP